MSPLTSARSKKRIGILGGSGPEAGADLFCKVMALHRTRLGAAYTCDRDAPDVVLMNVSGLGGPRSAADVEEGSAARAASWAALEGAIEEIAPLVDAFAVACNTLHIFESAVRSKLEAMGRDPSAFVSMIACTSAACGRVDGRVAIFGGPVTMDLCGDSPYRRLADDLGARAYRAPDASVEALQTAIWQVKAHGAPSGPPLAGYERLLRDVASQGVRIVVLGCTELPLIPLGSLDVAAVRDGALAFVDPTALVAAALLDALT